MHQASYLLQPNCLQTSCAAACWLLHTRWVYFSFFVWSLLKKNVCPSCTEPAAANSCIWTFCDNISNTADATKKSFEIQLIACSQKGATSVSPTCQYQELKLSTQAVNKARLTWLIVQLSPDWFMGRQFKHKDLQSACLKMFILTLLQRNRSFITLTLGLLIGYVFASLYFALDSYDEPTLHTELTDQPKIVPKPPTPRIVCMIFTRPAVHATKAKAVLETWAKRCDKALLFTTQEMLANDTTDAIRLPIPEGRQNLWQKAKTAFNYTYQHHLNDGDWFYKADDDT